MTLMSTPAATSDAVAVTTALPSAADSTSPEASTRATRVSLDIQVNLETATAWPFASVASAMRRTVSPNASRVSAAGDTETAFTTCATVTTALPATEPAVAVIVALPFAAAVTCPEASTRATSVSLDSQENPETATAWPFASVASADEAQRIAERRQRGRSR